MKRVFSAGGIVFNNQGQVLLTQNSANHYWGFPKGTVDADDASRAAWKAVRLSMAVRLTTEDCGSLEHQIKEGLKMCTHCKFWRSR